MCTIRQQLIWNSHIANVRLLDEAAKMPSKPSSKEAQQNEAEKKLGRTKQKRGSAEQSSKEAQQNEAEKRLSSPATLHQQCFQYILMHWEQFPFRRRLAGPRTKEAQQRCSAEPSRNEISKAKQQRSKKKRGRRRWNQTGDR